MLNQLKLTEDDILWFWKHKPKPVKKAHGGFVKAAGGTKRVPGSGAATKGTNFEGIF